MNTKFVCDSCGSDNIVVGATACWSVALQTWEFNFSGEDDYCYDCHRTAFAEEVPLTELKDVALVAAHTPIFKTTRSKSDERSDYAPRTRGTAPQGGEG